MTKLFIDTSDRKKVKIGIDDEIFEETSKVGSSQRTLQFIEKLLLKKGINFKDLTEIEVNTGPGSFTGLRVGVTIAQMIGWSLKIKVNGKDVSKGEIVNIKYH